MLTAQPWQPSCAVGQVHEYERETDRQTPLATTVISMLHPGGKGKWRSMLHESIGSTLHLGFLLAYWDTGGPCRTQLYGVQDAADPLHRIPKSYPLLHHVQ